MVGLNPSQTLKKGGPTIPPGLKIAFVEKSNKNNVLPRKLSWGITHGMMT